jgi:hypothetical protein
MFNVLDNRGMLRVYTKFTLVAFCVCVVIAEPKTIHLTRQIFTNHSYLAALSFIKHARQILIPEAQRIPH